MVIFIVLLSVILTGFIIFAIFRVKQKKYKNFVLQNSICLQRLKDINSRYTFNPYINFDINHTYDNKIFYDTVSCEDYLIYQLQFKSKKISKQIQNIHENKQLYSNYLSEVNAVSDFGKFQSPIKKLKLKKLLITEKDFFKKYLLSPPTQQFSLTVTLFCSTLNGHIYDRKTNVFYDYNIMPLIKRLNNKQGTFYNDRDIWDSLCRVERGKVSNKMRFSIYKRDGYRCRQCGVSQRYTDLEIDHIIPIAKGGKTTYDNLQTLCHSCNVEKGDSLY